MSMLAFMPWCRIDKPYEIGCIRLLPFERHTSIEDLDEVGQCRVNTILATYKTIEGRPLDRGALVRYSGRSPIDDLKEGETSVVHELVSIGCFCGLAAREYFNPLGAYCNTDCFMLYFQKFDRADFSAITTRRREGQTSSTWPIDSISFTIPVHCEPVREVKLDEALLRALANHRATCRDWARWQNALACFNQANTDSDNIRHQVEWVLSCSAFEHILKAKPNAADVAAKFSNAVVPAEPVLASNASRKLNRWSDDGQSLRYEWMHEFYRIRGDFAHGKLTAQQPTVWSPLEHLVLATIAFPLVVRCLLKKDQQYALKDDDRTQIEAFERLADTTEFLKPPLDWKSSLDSHWSRLYEDCRSRLLFKMAFEECQAKAGSGRD